MTLSDMCRQELKVIVGYTTSQHLCLDLDDVSLSKVIGLTCELMYNYPELGKCQIMQSSEAKGSAYVKINRHGIPRWHFPKPSYHLVFDNVIGERRCWEIMNTLICLGIQPPQVRQIKARRRDMTLRVSPSVYSTQIKPAPKPVMQIINIYTKRADGKIRDYHKFRCAVAKLFKSVSPVDPAL